MNAAHRLRAAQLTAIAGAAVALLGITIRWFSVIREGRTLSVPDFGTVPFPDEITSINGIDLGAGLPTLTVVLALAGGLGLLAGGRFRRAALGVAVLGAVGVIVLAVTVSPGDAIAAAPPRAGGGVGGPTVASAAGRIVTIVGAAVALAGAAFGLPAVSSIGDVQMPERGPSGA